MVLQRIAPPLFLRVVEGEESGGDIQACATASIKRSASEHVEYGGQLGLFHKTIEVVHQWNTASQIAKGFEHLQIVQSELGRDVELGTQAGLVEPLHTREPLLPVVAFQGHRQAVLRI